MSGASEAKLFEMLGDSKTDALVRLDGEPLGQGVPSYLVKSAEWIGWPADDDDDDEEVRIIGLGQVFHHSTVPEKLAQRNDGQAPEIIFTGRFDYRVDLWRLGIVVSLPAVYIPSVLTDTITDLLFNLRSLAYTLVHKRNLYTVDD